MRSFLIIFVLLGFWSFVAQSQICRGRCIAGRCPQNLTCVPSTGRCCLMIGATTPPPCADTFPNCANLRNYCNNSIFYSLMTSICPKTCGRCTSTCEDKINPITGTSICPAAARFCNNPAFYDLLTEECPRTCGRC